jgi:cytolysin-activating lysine-acyltransferase
MNTPFPAPAAARRPDSAHFELLGKLAWLWMSSPLQHEWTMTLAARFLLPPIALGQVQLLERDGVPVAYCSWAWLTPEAERRYLLDASAISAEDWQGGDRLWFADWVAPFSAADSWALRRLMAQRFPDEVARAVRVKRGRKNARVMEFRGSNLPPSAARARLKSYHADFIASLKAMPPSAGVKVVPRAASDRLPR